jgi:adenosylcobinamide-GDP ribazoletransferase
MNDGGRDNARASGELAPPPGGFLTELRLAAGFLTILPVMPARAASDEAVAGSLAWFPLIGFALGAALCVVDFVLGHIFGRAARSVLTILVLTIATGAVHLDGLADSADALGARGDRERALAILRDSRIGSFGAAAVFFALALKVAALASLVGARRYAALYVAVGFSRWAIVAVASGLDYLRADGAGSALLARASALSRGGFAIVVTIAAALPVISWRVAGAAAAVIAITLMLRWFYRRWLGGVTGDLIGACGEIAEVAALLAMSI